jgi:hypothetical protein
MSSETRDPADEARVSAYLELARELCSRVEDLVGAANAALRAGPYRLTFRDRILIGLALKIDSALRALIDDVRLYRSESMHHLKTMAESYIYFWYVVRDSTEVTAKRVLADTHHAYALFLEETEGSPDEIRDWRAERDALRAGAEKLPDVKTLADAHGEEFRKAWYSRVYRLACESAHTGDLFAFMPDPDDQMIHVNAPGFASQTARYAIHHALEIVLDVIETASRENVIGLKADVSDLRDRYKAVPALTGDKA